MASVVAAHCKAAQSSGRFLLVVALVIVSAALPSSASAEAAGTGDAGLFAGPVDDASHGGLAGVKVLYQGPAYQDFERPLPEVVEGSVFASFEDYFNQTQEFNAEGPNTYFARGRQLVVSIQGGRVTGVLGNVFDANGKASSELSVLGSSTVQGREEQQLQAPGCKHFKRLATVIQKYGQMYYHFVQEVMPRIILLRPYLDAETKILTFGSSHELKWLVELGIPPEAIEVYDPEVLYCADELLVPTVSPVITPPQENYQLLQTAFHADAPLPDAERNLIIYCSRRSACDRQVANEDEILEAVAQRYPEAHLYTYTGKEAPAETIRLFRRAKVVMGMHGAGLSHSVFSAPGTAIIEFLFMLDPPMMFWHAAAALRQRYIMVPLAQSWWLDSNVEVPEQDVLDALALALGGGTGSCQAGHVMDAASGTCTACPAGSYRPAGASACLACPAGRIAPETGSGYCSTCPTGTISGADAVQCVLCPPGTTTLLLGAFETRMCVEEEAVERQLDAMFARDVLAKKLVALPALEQPKPKTIFERISAAVSPQAQLAQQRHRQLRYMYLEQLFDSGPAVIDREEEAAIGGLIEGDAEDEGQLEGGERRLAQYSTRRLSQYSRRSLHQSYTGERRSLLQYGGGRRSLMQYGDTRRSLLQYGGERRSLLQYRRLSQYSGRSLLSGTNSHGRRTRQYRRRLSQYARRLSQYGRKLMQYARRR